MSGIDDPFKDAPPRIQYDAQGRPKLPEYDWQIVASQGHVVGMRFGAVVAYYAAKARLMFAGSLLVAIGALIFTATQQGGASARLEGDQPRSAALDRGVKVGNDTLPWNLFWWPREFPSGDGMTARDWNATVDAVTADLKSSGLKVDTWKSVAKLADGGPLVTKPSRLFRPWADSLGPQKPLAPELSKGGIVLVPEQPGDPLSIAAVVTGNPAWIVISNTGCTVVAGPDRPGCKRGIDRFSAYFDRMAPDSYDIARVRGALGK